MIRYYKLFDLLNRRNMKKTDLLEIITSPTLAKLSKGENVQIDSIDKICSFLKCQPYDIMEHIEDIATNDSDNETGKYITIKSVINELDESEEDYQFVKDKQERENIINELQQKKK